MAPCGTAGRSGNTTALVLMAAVLSICIFAVNCAVDAGLNWSWSVVGRRMSNRLAMDLFHKLQRRRLTVHYRSSIGDLLNRISGDSWCVQEVTASVVMSPVKNILTLITLGSAGWWLNPKLSILSLLLAPLLAASSWFFGRKTRRKLPAAV